jgi:segregation and condensation protein A
LDWSPLDQYLIDYLVDPSHRTTVLASSFAAMLELVREGHMEVHQQGSFTPLYLRKRQSPQNGNPSEDKAAGAMAADSGNG